jgi:tetratricopeptide (TPR) repeat protein
MRGVLIAVWLLVPVLAAAYHYGPGQQQMQLDDVQALLSAARADVAQGQHAKAAEAFSEVLEKLPAEHQAEAQRVRVERAKALLQSQQLPKAFDELTLLVPELQKDPKTDPAVLADARQALANAQYYVTWLERLEGDARPEWEPDIEGARQTYRLLAEQAEARGDHAAAQAHQQDLEAAIRLERMDLSELQALPLPSQCKGCCSGQCQCKGGKGKGKSKGPGKTPEKKQGDEQARGASSGPPPDDGGN